MIRISLACVGMALACLATLAHAQSPPRPQDQDLCAQARAANELVALTDAGLIDQTRVGPLHVTARLLTHQMLGHAHERRIYRLLTEEKSDAKGRPRTVTVIAVSEASPDACPWRDPPFYVVSRRFG